MCANKKIRELIQKTYSKPAEPVGMVPVKYNLQCDRVFPVVDKRHWKYILEQIKIESHELGHE